MEIYDSPTFRMACQQFDQVADRLEIPQAEREYARLVGEVTMGWNSLHANFLLLFSILLHQEPSKVVVHAMGTSALGEGNLGPALWHSLTSDDAQRSLLIAVIRLRIADRRLRENMLWVLDRTGRLATYRNDAAHVYAWDQGTDRRPNVAASPLFGPPKRVARLIAVGTRRLYRALGVDLRQLR